MLNKGILNSSTTAERNSYRFKKLACTLAAVALSFSCAAALSGCANKAKTTEGSQSSVSESAADNIEDSFFTGDSDDAGLNFKTTYRDVIEMDVSVPENAEVVVSDSDDIPDYDGDGDSTGGKSGGESYLWEKDGIYYQWGIDRWMFDKCPGNNSTEYYKFLDIYKKTPKPRRYKSADGSLVALADSDWGAAVIKKYDSGCVAKAGIAASKKLNEKLQADIDMKSIDYSYYDTHGATDEEKALIKPVLKAVLKKTIESFEATD